MSEIPQISEAEWRVMSVLWAAESAITANEVIHALENQTDWKPKTIMTLLNRLVKKGALDYEKQGRAYHYYPLVQESVCARAEGRSFLRRVYGGALQPMLAGFLDDAELSTEEIKTLKKMLDTQSMKRRSEK